ncbi:MULTISPECIES: phosphoribosyl-ATP diphosphatase [Commensalibacter]|uniref:phosphoribosyl-ATP diphosphatase n=1 Tax=Commensalibacter TaxID=1079922 RepID=UPI0018DD3323|nr:MULTISPECIES: phosphoribosyl-ATP diphosphatase [Commensalibacter]MBH9973076.1 phosphoribosyl-ATP diphosphatase [Commensalibacter melissae]MBI0016318.1 phosphoribosyl-ATP diphosphatase [Commensalibacter sp. B14384M2]MBI0018069.1 phosphoribosyl-ATP diphosphatase [Commensalibacter sp. W8133]MBI0049191.1 phosphoribosyl-ATP diphosphatase [Commensalibacter sp. B14384M3]MBI0178847.1 phosphoribosyl-ATP diphosphatase [Commensalibacter sp. W8163]
MKSNLNGEILDRLYKKIEERKNNDPQKSYSAKLLKKGSHKVAQKFGEEAVECLIECATKNPQNLISESADVLYHLLAMWVITDISPEDVWAELHKREKISGIEEKTSRNLKSSK